MDIQNISSALFNKLRGQFPSITVGDSDGNVTNNPKEARFFDFDFVQEGKSFGKISISISEDQGLVVLHSTDIISEADPSTKASWYNFLKELREFAKARLMSFDTRDITKSNLEKRDYEFLKKENEMEPVSESNMFGTNKTSFQQIGDAKLVVKHSTVVNPDVPGSRSQKIESIFIESPSGERFKFPLKHLNGARAMTRHVAEGGNPYDAFGKYIVGLSEELNKLRKFKTYMNRSNVMAEGLKDYLIVIDERIEEIKNTAQKLQKESGYKSIKETHSETVLEEVPEEVQKNWIDELTIKQFNEELKDVFPYIYKLVSERTAIKDLTPEDFETEAHGYQGSVESRTLRFDVAGDFSPENPVTEKDAEEIQQELAKAGIVADVQADESRHQGIIIHTSSNPEAVKDALGSMVETLNTFEEFEKELNAIVTEEENSLFSSDKTESQQALEKLNTLMAKHFPAGPNGVNGIESLQGIIDDKELNTQIKMASKEDADICIRPMILDFIQAKKPEMISKINTGDMKTEDKGTRSGVEITPELKQKVQAWWDKYSKYKGGNGNTMAQGYLDFALDSGIGTDAYNADEYMKVSKEMGMDNDDSDAETEIDDEELMKKMPITKAMFDEIVDITGKQNIEDSANIVNDVVKHFIEKEGIVKEVADAETEISDGIFVVQRGDNADGVSDEDPYVIGELYADSELSAEEIQKTLQDYVQSKNLAPKVDFRPESGRRPDDSGSSVIDGKAYRGEVVMNWLGDKPNEAITFEDIKPYVSMYKGKDGKIVHDILDKDGKSVTTFNNAKDAIDFLSKNFDKLRNKDVKEDKKDDFEYPEDGKYGYKAEVGKTDADITIHDKETDEILHIKDMQNVDIEDQETLAMIWDENKDVKEKTTAHDLDTDYEGSFEYELPGDDGEMAYGKIHYKAINGKVDPNSLRGEYEYDGNHKVDDDFANEMIKPGGPEHEEALKAAQEDYDYESDRMRSKFGEDSEYTDQQIKQAFGILNDPRYKGGNYDGAVDAIEKLAKGLSNHPSVANALKRANEDNSLSNKQETVEDFVKSFFDYTSNQFPKGETAVLTSVEKKFGDNAVRTAQETIQKLMANKDPEIAKIKKLAGI